MTSPIRLLLIRHAAVPESDVRLHARTPNIALSAEGRDQASDLAGALASWPIHAIYSSPQARARETARAVARPHARAVSVSPFFDELDAGRWTGLTFAALSADPAWTTYNAARSTAGCPGGESALEVCTRVRQGLIWLARRHPGRAVAVVTHAEVIRTAVLDALGLSLDDWTHVPIDPASVTILLRHGGRAEVVAINVHRSELGAAPAAPMRPAAAPRTRAAAGA
jgi:probable phosphoglycerate mutase